MSESFYVIADNRSALGSSRFLSYLPTCVKLPENKYEVAVTSFEYVMKKPKFVTNTEIKISWGNIIVKDIIFNKTVNNQSIIEFLTQANTQIFEGDLKLDFGIQNVQGKRHIRLTHEENGFALHIPEPIARAFGFTDIRFVPGSHISENPISEDKFSEISSSQNLRFYFATIQDEKKFSLFPPSIPNPENFDEIWARLKKVFTDNRLGEMLELVKTDTELEIKRVENFTKQFKLQFFPELNIILEKPSNFTITENTKFPIPKWKLEDKKINIFMDGLAPTMIGSSIAPLLVSFRPQQEFGIQKEKDFYPRNYVHVEKTQFDYLKFYITNDKNEDASFGDELLRVTLHFRARGL
jgi:hypothetical protein